MAGAVEFNERTIAEFRASQGQVGGQFAGAPLLLLHTVGARSGQPRVNPVMYLADGGRYTGFAGYQRNTARTIPVIALTPLREPRSVADYVAELGRA